MYTVLLAVGPDADRSLRAAETVAGLPCSAREMSATALNVFEAFDVADADGPAVSSDDIFEDADPPESLRLAVEYLEERSVDVTARREHGDPASEIVAAAAEIDADVVVMGGRRRSPVGKAVFGSVIQSVLLNSDRPVTIAMGD